MPPLSMLNTGKQTTQFFDSYDSWNNHANQNEKKYRLKSLEQYSREHNSNEQPGKQYFKATSLPEIINTAPMPTSKSSRQAHELENGQWLQCDPVYLTVIELLIRQSWITEQPSLISAKGCWIWIQLPDGRLSRPDCIHLLREKSSQNRLLYFFHLFIFSCAITNVAFK